ncbi:30S ribosomal protein S3 [Geochorda subterranea]|uniref:Small ribosomal subunit protein uS3 n=1 Tax=Geochorda subterranea TaxID=3109564 RepID=A0ABZ1BPX1_9FIRM|nr:30S ribosomal protein S3 [Limnochorda sp. LNt]WRP14152.1 30S ribosomal protein S3 [Limnochorda sp. LNt]
MGQKVHPYALRLGVIKGWQSRWFGDKKGLAALLHEDLKLRRYIKQRFYQAGVSAIEIERAANTVRITVHTARPGMIIGKQGAEVDRLRQELEQMTGREVRINVVEIEKPDLDAQLVAENIAFQLERRISFRRAMRQAMQRAMRLGAKGIRVAIAGRIAGAEIARYEWATEGSVPLTTLRADIDYGMAEANTTYGKIGVKVWIYKGEVLPEGRGGEGGHRRAEEAAQGARATEGSV